MVPRLLLAGVALAAPGLAVDESLVRAQSAQEKHKGYRKRTHVKFFQAKEAEEGVLKLPSGVLFQVLDKGGGMRGAGPEDSCEIHYSARVGSENGTVFDSTYGRNRTNRIRIREVQIHGWAEALRMMCEGDRWRLFVPYWQSPYGEAGLPGKVPGYTPLVYDLELAKVQSNSWRSWLARRLPGGAGQRWEEQDARPCAAVRRDFQRETKRPYDEL